MAFSATALRGAAQAQAQAKRRAAERINALHDQVFDVVVVGAGLTGASAAYHLVNTPTPPSSLLLVDQGEIGTGTHERMVLKPTVALDAAPRDYAPADDGPAEDKSVHPAHSGGVVFSPPHFQDGPGCLKFSVRLYPVSTVEFVRHHGEAGARRYLRLAALGIEMQKALARRVVPEAELAAALEEEGSVLVAEQDHAKDLEEEFRLLQKLGCDDIELWGEDRLAQMHGKAAGFVRGIFFPHDARVNALCYVNALAKATAASARCKVTVVEHCPAVASVKDVEGGGVETRFASGAVVRSAHAVLATNGLFLSTELAGILRPCWSYFTALPHPRDPLVPRSAQPPWGKLPEHPNATTLGSSSPNFFTYGFSHDWCVTDGVFRISGEDHYSALKPPRAVARSRSLADWSLAKYPYMRDLLGPDGKDPSGRWMEGRYVYGVYGETPDQLPLVGKLEERSRICYAVGCNAWGQSCMTFAASLVPGILGFAPLSHEQAELADLLAFSRFNVLPAYLKAKL